MVGWVEFDYDAEQLLNEPAGSVYELIYMHPLCIVNPLPSKGWLWLGPYNTPILRTPGPSVEGPLLGEILRVAPGRLLTGKASVASTSEPGGIGRRGVNSRK